MYVMLVPFIGACSMAGSSAPEPRPEDGVPACDVAEPGPGEGEDVRIGIARMRIPEEYREGEGTREGTRIWMGTDSSRIILSVTTGGQFVISGSDPGGFSSCLLPVGGRPMVATLYHVSHKADSAFIATIERVLGDTLSIGAGVVSRTRGGRARGLGVLKTLQLVVP